MTVERRDMFKTTGETFNSFPKREGKTLRLLSQYMSQCSLTNFKLVGNMLCFGPLFIFLDKNGRQGVEPIRELCDPR